VLAPTTHERACMNLFLDALPMLICGMTFAWVCLG
jgi:hypothetical protein